MSDIICPACKGTNPDGTKICKICGTYMQYQKPVSQNSPAIYGSEHTNFQYRALEILGTVYSFIGWLVLLAGIVAGLFWSYQAIRYNQLILGGLILLGWIIGGIVLALPMLASRDVIRWMLDLHSNVSTTVSLLRKLVPNRTRLSSSHDEGVDEFPLQKNEAVFTNIEGILKNIEDRQETFFTTLLNDRVVQHSENSDTVYQDIQALETIDDDNHRDTQIGQFENSSQYSTSDSHPQQRYKIIFTGRIQKEENIEDVKRNFHHLYKNQYSSTDVERLFFSGKPVIIKRSLEHPKALKLQQSLTKRTGGIFNIEIM